MICDMFNCCNITIAESSLVAQAIRAAKFEKTDEETLLAKVAERMSSQAAPTHDARIRKGQDFLTIHNFLPDEVWVGMKGDDGPMALFDFAIQLGLRWMTEPTAQHFCALLLLSTDGFDKAMGHSQQVRTTMLKSIKSWFARRSASAGLPIAVIKELPPSPAYLQRSWPEVYASVYKSTAPARCPYESLQIETLKEATPMRAPKVSRKENATLASGPSTSLGSLQEIVMALQPLFCREQQGEALLPGLKCFPRARSVTSLDAMVTSKPTRRGSLPTSSSRSSLAFDDELQTLAETRTNLEILPLPPSSPSVGDESGHHVALPGAPTEAPAAIPEAPKEAAAGKKRKSVAESMAAVANAIAEKKATKIVVKKKPASAMDFGGKAGEEIKESMPSYSDEKTRGQFMARSGLKGKGQSARFPYTPKTKAKQEAACKAFCRKLCLDRGLGVPARFK